jgi:hypothetical protein
MITTVSDSVVVAIIIFAIALGNTEGEPGHVRKCRGPFQITKRRD